MNWHLDNLDRVHPRRGRLIGNVTMKKAWMLLAAVALGCSKAQLPVEPPKPTTPAAATLQVTAINPEGEVIEQADVYIDGQKVGTTPFVNDELAVGAYTLRLVKTGYRVFIDNLRLESNKQYKIEALMQPLGPTQGELFVTVDQENARLQVIDFSQNVINQTTSRETALLLSPGGYFVSAEKAGYNKSLIAVAVKAGEATVVNLQMQAVNSAPLSPAIILTMADSARAGEDFTVRWSSINATRVDVDFVTNPGLQGAALLRFTPLGWHVVRATAHNESLASTTVDSVYIYDSVMPPPAAPTISLTSTPDTITVGQKVNLTWRSTNATTVNVDYVSQPSLNGSAQVQFDIIGAFTIHATAYGLGGQATAQTTVVVKEAAPITMSLSFTASPDSVEFGKTALLQWQTNGSYVIIDHGVGTRGPVGEEEISFASPGQKTITATAYGPSNLTIARQARVYVKEAPQPLQPVIMLSVTPKVDVNAPATITWLSQNADYVVVDYLGTVAASGSVEKIFPTVGTRYITATAYNASGYASAIDTVDVVSQPPVEDPVADIIIPAAASVRADIGEEGYNSLNVGSFEIRKAGYYRISAEAWFNSGDDQRNESFYILVRHTNGTISSPRDGNAGVYMVVEDEAGAPHTSTRDCGTFYLDAGTNTIDLHHYAKIASLYPQFVNGRITGAESVSALGFKIAYVGN
jgi:hypothetical protein